MFKRNYDAMYTVKTMAQYSLVFSMSSFFHNGEFTISKQTFLVILLCMRKGGKSLIMRIQMQSFFLNIACNNRSGTSNVLEDVGLLKTNLKTLCHSMNARFPFSQLEAIEFHSLFARSIRRILSFRNGKWERIHSFLFNNDFFLFNQNSNYILYLQCFCRNRNSIYSPQLYQL